MQHMPQGQQVPMQLMPMPPMAVEAQQESGVVRRVPRGGVSESILHSHLESILQRHLMSRRG